MSLFLHLHSSQTSYVMKHTEETTLASLSQQVLFSEKEDQDMSKVTSLLTRLKSQHVDQLFSQTVQTASWVTLTGNALSTKNPIL